MRSKECFNKNQVQVLPFTLLPSSFPRKNFEKAKSIQILLNELIHKVAHNDNFLRKSLKRYIKLKMMFKVFNIHRFTTMISLLFSFFFSTINADPFTAKLFEIYETIYDEGYNQVR